MQHWPPAIFGLLFETERSGIGIDKAVNDRLGHLDVLEVGHRGGLGEVRRGVEVENHPQQSQEQSGLG